MSCLTFAVIAAHARAELKLPAVFGDHMVLQREKAAPVWGWAEVGQAVRVEIAGQSHEAKADDTGRWRVDLTPLSAGGPHTLTVAAGDETVVIDDVLVGEVWLCSGQSNMDMRLAKVNDAEAEVAAATNEQVRLFRVERAIAGQPVDDLEGRWAACEPAKAKDFSAAAYFMGRKLQEELQMPIGLIHSAYGGTPGEAWLSEPAISGNPALTVILDRWQKRLTAYEAGGGAEPPARYAPAGLFNAMIHPLIPYAVRGFTWYQGESNIWRSYEYRALLPALIGDWRQRWGDDTLAFGVVQLPNYSSPPRVPRGNDSWEELREAQLITAMSTPHTGMIVTIDIGDPTDIHPRNKQEVGRRLALWALGAVHERDVVYSGPIYREAKFEGHKAVLTFDHVGSGLETSDGKPVRGFVIAGKDGKFRWASDVVIEGDTITVWDQKIDQPMSVRYAWDDDPHWANLVNREGLPASPFRTDDWPGITGGE